MKVYRASRVAVIWAICLQLLAAPVSVAIESPEQNIEPVTTSVNNTEENQTSFEISSIVEHDTTTEQSAEQVVLDDVDFSTQSIQVAEEAANESQQDAVDAPVNYDLNQQSGIIITQVQTSGGSGRANEELVEIRNNTSIDMDITSWRLAFNEVILFDFTPTHTGPGYRVILPAGAVMVLATAEFVKAHAGYIDDENLGAMPFIVDGILTSGKITNANGSIRIYDNQGIYVSGLAWGAGSVADGVQMSALNSQVGGVIERKMLLESIWHQDTRDNSNDFVVGNLRDVYVAGSVLEVYDMCLNIELIQSAIPEGLFREDSTGDCNEELPAGTEPTSNSCESLVISEVGANLAAQFIEIQNESDKTLELGGCRLITNRSDTKFYQFKQEQLAAGAYRSVAVPKEAELTLTKSTSGTVYLVSEGGQIEIDSVSYANLKTDTSWALIDGAWYQTYTPTPGEPNIYEQFLPCEDGYTRNLETGRCNKIVVLGELEPCGVGQIRNPDTGRCRLAQSASGLTPCREGQVRNPETNRCRNIASSISTLVPCGEGQIRNPETNRCRSVASSASALQPCQDGWERNPDTNRCRKVASLAGADDFPVEPISEVGKGFAAWWALGGLTALGIGYGAWEWRRELAAGMRRVGGIMSK